MAAFPLPGAAAWALVEFGDDSFFISWLQATLPPLKTRLEVASRSVAGESDQLRFAQRAVPVGRMMKIGVP